MRRASILAVLLLLPAVLHEARADVGSRLLIMRLASADLVAADRTALAADTVCVTDNTGTYCGAGDVSVDPAFITGFADAVIPTPDGGQIVVEVAATGTGIPMPSASLLRGLPALECLRVFPPAARVRVELEPGYSITRDALGVGTARRYASNGSLTREYGQSRQASFSTEHSQVVGGAIGFCPR